MTPIRVMTPFVVLFFEGRPKEKPEFDPLVREGIRFFSVILGTPFSLDCG